MTPKLGVTVVFLKQSLLLTTKYSQKFTFNFIKLFKQPGPSGQLSFNELNLRKCLTIQLCTSQTLLQVLEHFENPCQAENLSILLRFSLDSEGDTPYWCKQVLACFQQSQSQLKMITAIAKSFVDNCEFKEQAFRGM